MSLKTFLCFFNKVHIIVPAVNVNDNLYLIVLQYLLNTSGFPTDNFGFSSTKCKSINLLELIHGQLHVLDLRDD